MSELTDSIEEEQGCIIEEVMEIADGIEDAVRIISEHLALAHAFIERHDLLEDYEEFINEVMIDGKQNTEES